MLISTPSFTTFRAAQVPFTRRYMTAKTSRPPATAKHTNCSARMDQMKFAQVVMKWAREAVAVSGVLIAALWSGSALPENNFETALSLLSAAKYPEARRVLDPLLEREPDDPRLRLAHGILRLHEGNPDKAIGVFESLRRDHPDMLEPINNLAVLYALQGRLDDAREILLAALERRSEATLYANLGDVYTKLAERAYDKARSFEAEGDRPPPALTCLHAAGFKDAGTADEAARWLRSRNAESVTVHKEKSQATKWYRVYLPPLASRREATTLMHEIRGRGVRDIGIVGVGSLANAISFGVYRREDNMRRRVARLKEMGYSVQFEAKKETIETFAVEAHIRDGRYALTAAWEAQHPRRSLRRVECR